MYKVLGSDGTEYGPISAEKIQQWIRENRLGPKTPVMPAGADDWVFLSSLPEFAGHFSDSGKGEGLDAIRSRRWWQLVICLGLLVVALIMRALFIMGKIKHH